MNGAQALRVVDLQALTNGSIEWTRWRGEESGEDRVDICRLYGAEDAGGSAALLRYAPGARVPAHEHTGYEHIFVLSGYQKDELGEYRAGTTIVNPPGSRHTVWAPEGCVVLVVWASPVAFVAEP